MRDSSFKNIRKHELRASYKKRLEHLADIGDHQWFCSVYHKTADNGKVYCRRIYRSQISKYYKKLGHRLARRCKLEEVYKYGHFHKLFDYWWNMY